MGNNTWIINVSGYGSFFFEGNEKEAEEMRQHKARWEHGIARKRFADEEEIKTKIINCCRNHVNYKSKFRFDCDCGKCEKFVFNKSLSNHNLKLKKAKTTKRKSA